MKLARIFLFAFSFLVFDLAISAAQGILPPKKQDQAASTTTARGFLIGDTIPDTLTVKDENGDTRTLVSYKAPVDLLVVGFFSAHCSFNQAAWNELRYFYDRYKDWRVDFLAVSSNPEESLAEVREAMRKAGLPYSVARDEDEKTARALGVTATPEIIILDEYKALRYRGALHDAMEHPGAKPKMRYARQAMDNIIGHMDPVPYPEPNVFIGCPLQL